MREQKSSLPAILAAALKCAFSVGITVLAFFTVNQPMYLLFCLLELSAILLFSASLISLCPPLGHLVSLVLFLLYNAQVLVLRFSGSFTSLVMLTNLAFLEDLHGKFSSYLMFLVPMALLTLVPLLRFPRRKGRAALTLLAAAALEAAVLLLGTAFSPLANTWQLVRDYQRHLDVKAVMDELPPDAQRFYRSQLDNFTARPSSLPSAPNVVLIFAEGLSQSVIEDARGLTPNLQRLEEKSFTFDNYYNHTFATLRGLIGQLYSGHQFDNMDQNGLISLQDILQSRGYRTAMLNTEPGNDSFTEYLTGLRFQSLITDPTLADPATGYIHDKEAYELLFDTISEQHSSSRRPFFTCIYTFGTHVSLSSKDAVYGDGSSDLLNRFVNMDEQFGRFWQKFLASDMARDTLLIFTSDHATYVDDDYLAAFPDTPRRYSEVDRIPLCFYYKGIKPGSIDAAGRTSLDLAPTVLDYLDVSTDNFFLGRSLFAPAPAAFSPETVFWCFDPISTSGGNLQPLAGEDHSIFQQLLTEYFAVSRRTAEETEQDIQLTRDYVQSELNDDFSAMLLTLTTEKEYPHIWFAVWSTEGGQDDVLWYVAEPDEDGNWIAALPVRDLCDRGIYAVHVYRGDAEPEENLLATEFCLPDSVPYPPEEEIEDIPEENPEETTEKPDSGEAPAEDKPTAGNEDAPETDAKPTPTPVPTATPKPTSTPTPTATPKPTVTPTPTTTPKPTVTPTPTATPKPTVTPTPTATPKPTVTPTPTTTPKPTVTPSPTATPKPTVTPTPTATPKPTPASTSALAASAPVKSAQSAKSAESAETELLPAA